MKFLSQEKTELKPVSNHALIIFHFDGEKLFVYSVFLQQ